MAWDIVIHQRARQRGVGLAPLQRVFLFSCFRSKADPFVGTNGRFGGLKDPSGLEALKSDAHARGRFLFLHPALFCRALDLPAFFGVRRWA
jgi:hypothetical protein